MKEVHEKYIGIKIFLSFNNININVQIYEQLLEEFERKFIKCHKNIREVSSHVNCISKVDFV